MTNQSPGPTLSLSMSRVLAASPEQVFRAFTDPDWYGQWWGPEGTRSEVRQLDLQVGGAYRVDMHLPDGSLAVMYGRYREIDPPQLLAYSLAWEGDPTEMLVTLEFEPHEDGTELTVTHEGFTDQARAGQHEQGWASSLDRLVSLLANQS
ncbi:MAG: SRPBCC domain-containing protein [Chloroflexi bacterium]|nr:SRPBCC domain-containing protein [Chloroflexota bacterium]